MVRHPHPCSLIRLVFVVSSLLTQEARSEVVNSEPKLEQKLSSKVFYRGATKDETRPEIPGTYPGDPRRCLQADPHLQLFEVLPGYGWDNLRNKDCGSVVEFNYSLCMTTSDGRFLVPDNVETLPRKSSKVNTFAEIISHLSEYTSLDASSINVNAGLSLPSVSISGSFTDSYQHARSKEIGSTNIVTRVQLRYVRYTARLRSGAELSREFRARLLEISSHLEKNQRAMARYLSQVLVRDFGSHYLYSTDAGAILVQEDQISSAQNSSSESVKKELKIGASASFFNIFHFSMSDDTSSSTEQRHKYEQNRTSSEILTFGGPKFRGSNFTANDWADGVDENMVAVDRSGAPLSFLITPSSLPELDESRVQDISSLVSEAVDLYYKFNSYPGCTQRNVSNFNPSANVDDGTCSHNVSKTAFGGAFQICHLNPLSNDGDFCMDLNMNQKNPKTGDYSCPEGFITVPIHSATLETAKANSNCWICPPFYHCCHHTQYYAYKYSRANYTLYWCAGMDSTLEDSGYLFGGLFTSKLPNPLTEGMSCPSTFYPIKLGVDLHICITDDFELGEMYSVPFGGFISCDAGNPLAVSKSKSSSKSLKSLRGFFDDSNVWPKQCPQGYSRHLAFIDQGCEINYCTKLGSLKEPGPLKVKLPPYMTPPKYSTPIKLQVMDPETRSWLDIEKMNVTSGNQTDSGSGSGVTLGGIIGISIGCMLFGVIFTVAMIVLMNVRRRAGERRGDPLLANHNEEVAIKTVA